jgi:DNA-directed RNA polymerase specialized sigma subunit
MHRPYRTPSPDARTRLAAFVEGYAERETALERQAESLRRERDQAIRRAYADGLPMTAIARTVGMSHQRVSQIVRS